MHTQTTDGVALQLHAGEIVASRAAALRAQRQVFDLLVMGQRIGVTIAGLEPAEDAEDLFGQLCELLATALNEAEALTESLVVITDAGRSAPQRLWSLRRDALGPGPLYLLLDGKLTRPSANITERQQQDQFWVQYWQLRNNSMLRAAMAPIISSPCPLFAPEFASGVLPPSGIQVPVGTAWATLRIDVMDYCDKKGEINAFGLREGIRRCVEYGEQLHDETAWPTAAMRFDSWSNRRLAITVDGIGDLARARNFDPRSLLALQELNEFLSDVREMTNECSRQLALDSEHAPSLRIDEPASQASGIIKLTAWQQRWQAALQFSATRHRNLLAMSPWSVFPTGTAADSRYSDLLPLLAQADVCSFPQAPCTESWNINEFKHFHRRLWAVLEQKDAQQMIAEQV